MSSLRLGAAYTRSKVGDPAFHDAIRYIAASDRASRHEEETKWQLSPRTTTQSTIWSRAKANA
jgi:hypothetical protein